jgi:hypothetical protein
MLWSTTAANNATADGAIPWSDTMAPDAVDNSGRSMMAAIAKWRNDISGAIISTGAGNEYTIATAQGIASLVNGLLVTFRADKTSTGAATTTVDSTAQKSIFRADGTATVSGDIVSGGIYPLMYSTTAGGFLAVTIGSATSAASLLASLLTVDGAGSGLDADLLDGASSAVFARLDTADQVITGGARVTVNDLGTISSGTVTPDPGDRPHQKYSNNGAHTLAPGTNQGSYWLDITNAGSAGAITTSGWTKVVGSFTTTNGHKFACVCHISDIGSLLSIQAMQ